MNNAQRIMQNITIVGHSANQRRCGFTLVEIIASLLLMSFGLMSVIGMVMYASNVSRDYTTQATAQSTAESALYDPAPIGMKADKDPSDQWELITSGSAPAAPATGSYKFIVEGQLNGYLVHRVEESVDPYDIIDDSCRWATITVHIYANNADRYITSVRRRLPRRTR